MDNNIILEKTRECLNNIITTKNLLNKEVLKQSVILDELIVKFCLDKDLKSTKHSA